MAEDADDMSETDYEIPDERLRLIFTCCHPALNREAQLALTLRTLGGLTVREIARAFLTSEPAMLQRIARAKKKIKEAGIAYEVPSAEHIAERRRSVQKTIYLIFNESYSAFEGQSLTRDDLANEAIRLGEILFHLDPTPENGGLLALMMFTHARCKARLDGSGQMVSLENQDRAVWDQSAIERATAILTKQLRASEIGPYQLQAAISGLHCRAKNWAETDWQQIEALYLALSAFDGSPVIQLNAAMAGAYAGKIDAALEKLKAIETVLVNYQPFYAARADIYARQNCLDLARSDLARAIELTNNDVEKQFLATKLLKLSETEN
jgi:RNA polymerase sigma-70 factor (ECF subfamily)